MDHNYEEIVSSETNLKFFECLNCRTFKILDGEKITYLHDSNGIVANRLLKNEPPCLTVVKQFSTFYH